VGDLIPYKPPIWASNLHNIPKYRLPLARLPTPLLPLNLVVEDEDIITKNIWIKRDDLTEFLGAGNKIRKLEFLLADAVSKGMLLNVYMFLTTTDFGVVQVAIVLSRLEVRNQIIAEQQQS